MTTTVYLRNLGLYCGVNRTSPNLMCSGLTATNMIIAGSKAKISHPYLQFIIGHKGDIEARYSTNKGVLPPDMIEDMRKAYKECEPFLSTATQPMEQASIVKEAKTEVLKSMAKSLLGIDLLDVKVAKEKQIGRELNKEELSFTRAN